MTHETAPGLWRRVQDNVFAPLSVALLLGLGAWLLTVDRAVAKFTFDSGTLQGIRTQLDTMNNSLIRLETWREGQANAMSRDALDERFSNVKARLDSLESQNTQQELLLRELQRRAGQ